MSKRIMVRAALMMCVLFYAGTALGQDKVQNYFNDAAIKVKATKDPSQKREILSNKIQDMSTALDKIKDSSFVSESDRVGIDRTRASLKEKQDELAGTNGFTRVPDTRLNAFSDYLVQDMEQADKTITMSVVTALLIVIILLLIT